MLLFAVVAMCLATRRLRHFYFSTKIGTDPGYSINMSQDDARQLRPLNPAGKRIRKGLKKAKPTHEVYSVTPKPGFDGSVYFDGEGRLITYAAAFTPKKGNTDRASLEGALRDKLGQPLSDDEYARFWSVWNDPGTYGTMQTTAWLSESCDSLVELIEGKFAGLGTPILSLSIRSVSDMLAHTEARKKDAAELID